MLKGFPSNHSPWSRQTYGYFGRHKRSRLLDRRDGTKRRVHWGIEEDLTRRSLTGNATKATNGVVLYWQVDGIILKVLLSMLVSRTQNFAQARELFYSRQTAFGISIRQELSITNANPHQLANRRPAAQTCTSYGTANNVPSTPQIVYPSMLIQVLRLSMSEGLRTVSSRD